MISLHVIIYLYIYIHDIMVYSMKYTVIRSKKKYNLRFRPANRDRPKKSYKLQKHGSMRAPCMPLRRV